jgi:signal transduction histidine kinase/CheY-like chemotaxis protein
MSTAPPGPGQALARVSGHLLLDARAMKSEPLPADLAALQREVQELRDRCRRAEETLQAIRSGEANAFVGREPERERSVTLPPADRFYHLLVEGMAQGAVLLGADLHVLYCNDRFAQMAQQPRERIIGAPIRSLIAADSVDEVAGALSAGDEQGQLEVDLARESGPLPVLINVTCISEATGTRCLTVTDLTDRRYYRALQEADRRKDEFLAMLAHELRNPLAPIRNGVETLYRLLPDPLEHPDIGRARDMIDRQVSHMAKLLDDLLDLSRFSRGDIGLDRQPTELASVIAAAIESAAPLMNHRQHQLDVRVPERGLLVRADVTRLAQVFLNILNNAAKYTPEGGRVEIAATREHDQVVIRIRDNGIGIVAEGLGTIFTPFTQLDGSDRESSGGLGIGLALVKRFVELHDGEVRAHSDGRGKGSEFVVTLPLLTGAAVGETQHDPEVPATAAQPLKILVVDDNTDSALSMAMLLRMYGHEVEVAHDGPTAIETASSLRSDVVLLDLGLPRLDGYQVCQRLRQHGFDRMRIVAMTGYGSQEDRRRTREAQFDAHLVKPVGFEELQQLLAEYGAARFGADA